MVATELDYLDLRENIYLVRHGETQAKREDIFRGRNEIPLSAAGVRQAEALRGYFSTWACSASSPRP